MRRRTRKISALAAAGALAGALAASAPAGALQAGTGVLVLRSVATSVGVCYPGLHLITPACGATGIPVLGAEHSFTWSNTTFTPDGAGLDFCVAVNSLATPPVAVRHQTTGGLGGTNCYSTSSGQGGGALRLNGAPLGPIHPGGYCGLSSGWGAGSTIVNDQTASDSIMWVTSAGTVIPIEDGNLANSIYTVGVSDAIGALGGGNCGVTAVSQKFNVIGVVAAVSVTP
jgi:hypothetical protein